MSTLVYSTDSSKQRCPKCGQLECECKTEVDLPLEGQQATLRIDRKGRKGKSVTVVEGLSVNPTHLGELAKELKQKLGTGGTAKQGRIEIQGEHREKIAELLQEKGVKSKFSEG